MKTTLFSLFICIATISGNAMSYTIHGKIKGLMPGDTLSFERINLPGFELKFAFDVIVENQDGFTYNGSHKHIGYYMMSYKPISNIKFHSDKGGLNILLKDGITNLIGTADQIYYCQLQGGLYDNEPLQETLHLENSLGKERASFLKLFKDTQATGDSIKAEEYLNKFNSFHFDRKEDFKKLSLLKKEFYKKHPSSEHTITDALQDVIYAPFETSKEKYEKMSEKAKDSYFGKILKQEIEKIAVLQPGEKAPSFRLVAINGDEISLNNFAGTYVLIYHWGLCLGSLMIDNEVIELYNKYKDHLKVIGITDKIDNIKSLYENTPPGGKLMHIDLKPILANMLTHPWPDVEKTNNNDNIEKDYAFGGLPYFVFISPDGKIIARDFQKAFYTAKERMEIEFGK